MSAQAILRKLSTMWKALGEAEKQKWKDEAPLAKARKPLPPADAETEKQYEACGAAP